MRMKSGAKNAGPADQPEEAMLRARASARSVGETSKARAGAENIKATGGKHEKAEGQADCANELEACRHGARPSAQPIARDEPPRATTCRSGCKLEAGSLKIAPAARNQPSTRLRTCYWRTRGPVRGQWQRKTQVSLDRRWPVRQSAFARAVISAHRLTQAIGDSDRSCLLVNPGRMRPGPSRSWDLSLQRSRPRVTPICVAWGSPRHRS
jgi:hypothetical protein